MTKEDFRFRKITAVHVAALVVLGGMLLLGVVNQLKPGPMLALAAPFTLVVGSFLAFLSLDRSAKAALMIILFCGYMAAIQFIGSLYLIATTHSV
ncbi:MAG: hypothetical protein EOP83_04190 [Verrucomicrobiaceae bacterium]|nr:MAG: hypothetical protein EOP83_04190 [Verrucomicrobiaceae bacterium]